MKWTIFLLALLLTCSATIAQKNYFLQVYAGSNAPWGTSQSLLVEEGGKTTYYLTEVGKGDLDSSSFTLTKSELGKVNETLKKMNFYKLNAAYNEESVDGVALTVIAKKGQVENTVTWENIETKETKMLIDNVNAILKKRNIQLQY